MSHEIGIQPGVFKPEYWDGVDILDIPIVDRGESPQIEVGIRNYVKAKLALERAASNIYEGSRTDARYSRKMDFDPPREQLGSGSVVILEREVIASLAVGSPRRPSDMTVPIYTPYTDYWRENHDNPWVGTEVQQHTYSNDEEIIFYGRELNWGVIGEDKQQNRFIQPFSFGNPRIQEDQTFMVRHDHYANSGLPLPLEIGKVFTLNGDVQDAPVYAALRIRGVDVVYPAAGEKQQKKSRKLFGNLGRLSLHRPAPNPQT